MRYVGAIIPNTIDSDVVLVVVEGKCKSNSTTAFYCSHISDELCSSGFKDWMAREASIQLDDV